MSSLSIRDTIKGSIAIGKGEQGIQGVKGDKGDKGDNNVCVGLEPTKEAEIWFDTTDSDNTSELATKEYVDNEISKIDLSGNVNLSDYATKNDLLRKADKTDLDKKANKSDVDAISESLDNIENIVENHILNCVPSTNLQEQINDISESLDNIENVVENHILNYVPFNGNADTIDGLHLIVLTQAEYDGLENKDNNTLYFIKEV